MILHVLSIALLLICVTGERLYSEQKAPAAMQEPIPKRFEHEIPYVTTRIARLDGGMGTGFFYQTGLPPKVFGEGKSSSLLISARHVFYDEKDKDERGIPKPSALPTKQITLNLNKTRAPDLPIYGGGIHKTFIIRGNPQYWEHPTPGVDLACLNVSRMTHLDPAPYYKTVTSDFLEPIDYYALGVGGEVTFIGYPGDRYDVVNNLPLIRKGFLASLAYLDFGGRPELVIDAEAFPGSSGSPVFIVVGKKQKLLGVLARTFASAEEGYLGLGIVLKRELVKELIDYATHQITVRKSLQNNK